MRNQGIKMMYNASMALSFHQIPHMKYLSNLLGGVLNIRVSNDVYISE